MASGSYSPYNTPSPRRSYNLGYFDHSLINVPQAQDHLVYAGRTLLDEELGLINAYEPSPLQDILELENEYYGLRSTPLKRTTIKMEDLDDGHGRLRGGPKFVQAQAHLNTRAGAYEAFLRREQLGEPSTPPKTRYVEIRKGQAPRTVRNPTPISKQRPRVAAKVDANSSPVYFGFAVEGQHPTETILHYGSFFDELEPDQLPEFIDPVVLDSSAWDVDYRLATPVKSSYASSRANIQTPTPAKRGPKKRAAVPKKIVKALAAKKVVKKAAVSQLPVKEKEYRATPQTPPRRNSVVKMQIW